MEVFANPEMAGIWVVIGGVAIIFLLWNIILQVKLGRLSKNHKQLMGDTGVADLPNVMEQLHHTIQSLKELQGTHTNQLKQIQHTISQMKGNVGIHRYNAFADTGSDLSFSLALVDYEQDGVVISGLHSRDYMFVYAKPLEKGDSNYPLTEEEKHAISLALPTK